jgi:transcriptional regulator EpsA
MSFLPTLSAEDLHRYHQVVTHSVTVRSHFDLLAWLQGDMQAYLPHEILIASWGDFGRGKLQHDLISRIAGVRSNDSDTHTISPLMRRLYQRWIEFGKKPFTLNAQQTGFLLEDTGLRTAAGDALQTMRSAIVHGIVDERESKDCLYVGFDTRGSYSTKVRSAMGVILPYIDTALRRVAHLPHQNQRTHDLVDAAKAQEASTAAALAAFNLTERESEVLHWVAKGKTNPEIAIILDISSFTVKNHMQRVFRKLDVSNRAQAVSKYRPSSAGNVQV